VNGSRVWKIANGNNTYYVKDPTGKREVVQRSAYSSYYTYNIWGTDNIGQVVCRYPTAYRYYYLKDHLGSVKMTCLWERCRI